jgi:hypothetical protein
MWQVSSARQFRALLGKLAPCQQKQTHFEQTLDQCNFAAHNKTHLPQLPQQTHVRTSSTKPAPCYYYVHVTTLPNTPVYSVPVVPAELVLHALHP